MSEFFNKKLQSLESYTPGEQPRDKKYIKLNTNESPFPPSPKVVAAINEESIKNLRLYCDPTAKKLKEKLASTYGVSPENVFVANGSDDILNFSFLAFGENGVVFPSISYGFYEVFANLHGLESEQIPLEADLTIDTSKYFNKNKLIAIANPNAPTGLALSLDDIRMILEANKQSVVLIDEAYVDFGAQSASCLVSEYKNLICVQTYSKSRSMAGARLGFAIANKELISDLERIKFSTNPYNVNTLTQILGIATLEDPEYFDECRKAIIESRKYTVENLRALGFEVTDSLANFVFAKSDKIDGEKLYLELKNRGILVRHFSKKEIAQYNRITVGTLDEMKELIKQIKEILGE